MRLDFRNKNIILGVTGGIAAYKSALILRSLKEAGANVKVVMTPAATEFITPLTLSALSGNEVIVRTFPQSQANGATASTWHIDLAVWADLLLIAPATVNTIAKIAHGFADNALTTVACARRSKAVIAPAADMDMYNNPVNRENIEKLKKLGYYIVEAEEGYLASGLSGKGRMAQPEKILDAAAIALAGYSEDLAGKKILITAGPTYEDIDPVRYIGNRSSGKMGFELARSAWLRGADVTLISGPSAEKAYPEIKREDVRSAEEMYMAVKSNLTKNDILIMSAAVADYRPSAYSENKIKKEDGIDSIELAKTTDILTNLKKGNRFVAGFALETDNEAENARLKLSAKNLDMIVLNSLKDKDAGFEHDTNKITIIHKDGEIEEIPLASKFEISNLILSSILTKI